MVEKIKETRVTTESVELYVCPSCEQQYEDDKMVNVGLGVVKSKGETIASAEDLTMICENCSESVFGYDGELGFIEDVGAQTPNRTDEVEAEKNENLWTLSGITIATTFVSFILFGITEWDGFIVLFFLSWLFLPVIVYLTYKEYR